jgi:AraC family transcriptional regulator
MKYQKKWQEKLQQVLIHIEHHLDEDLSLTQLSSVACLSKYHFHRQFSTYFGITTNAYIKTLRLKRASFQLAYRTDKKIIDIALEQNYESSEAFSRAFKKCFGIAPTKFKHSPPWFLWQEKLKLLKNLRNTMKDKSTLLPSSKNINVELVNFPEVNVAIYQHRGAPYLLGESIQKFIHWRKQHKLSPNISRTFNLIYDDPNTIEAEKFRFDLCVQLPSILASNMYSAIKQSLSNEENMTKDVIPAGLCAKVRHVGSDDQLSEVIHYLYGEWLPNQKKSLRDFPLFFERVSFFPDVSEHEMITDVYLPLT